MSLSTDDGFDKAIAELQAKLDACEVTVKKSEGAMSPLLVTAMVAPMILFTLLYMLKPSFVTSEDAKGTRVRDKKKVFLWTLGVTLLLWGALYLYAQANALL